MKNWNWEAIVNMMDDEIRERVHAELAPCTNKDFYDRYCELHSGFDGLIRQQFSDDKLSEALGE